MMDVNSLERFQKRSPRLVLETHSHCEVPAGCGGVVLRWLDANRELPLALEMYCPGRARVFLDGVEQNGRAMLVAYGRHVLEVEIEEVPEGSAALALVLRRHLAPRWDKDQSPVMFTQADGTWVTEDGEALQEMPMLPPKRDYQWEWLSKREGRPIGLPGRTSLRLRREFEVAP